MARFLSSMASVGALILAAAWIPASAQQRPTFRASQTVVPVYVTVIDPQQRLVTDLVKEDFEIYDNEKLQQVVLFENKPLPITVVVMLDTSYSMEGNIPFVRRAAESFLLRLYPGDKAKVGAFNDKVQMMPGFTDNRDRLTSEVQKLDFGNGTHLWDATLESINALKTVDGRRVVLVFTDGDDVGSRSNLGNSTDLARAEDVMVYAIGLTSDYFNGVRNTRSKPDGGLKKIAEETGGGYFELEKTAELGATFTRVAQELHTQYSLGFVPTALDNKNHKLMVKLKRPGMTTRARKSYLAKEKEDAETGK